MEITPIGVIHTAYHAQTGTPIQGSMAGEETGTAEINPEYRDGLADLDGFSHVWLLYAFDRARAPALHVRPYLDDRDRGVFATRSPCRPNGIGMTAVRLLGLSGEGVLRFAGVDMLDGTPLLDIKPYIPDFDRREVERTGWYERCARGTAGRTEADARFQKP